MMPRIGVGAPGPGRAGPATQAGPAFDSADSVTGMLLPARPGRGPAERGAGHWYGSGPGPNRWSCQSPGAAPGGPGAAPLGQAGGEWSTGRAVPC